VSQFTGVAMRLRYHVPRQSVSDADAFDLLTAKVVTP
jgi:hypothetical protein